VTTTPASDAAPDAPATNQLPALLRDPELNATTFVVLDFEGTTPRGYSPEPTEVAAVALRRSGGRWERVWVFEALIKPPEHAPLTGFDIAQTGITPAMLAGRPGAGVVLGQFDARLADGPHLLVAHNTTTEGGIVYRYRDRCPALAATHLLDTVKLARALLPDAPGHGLDALIDHLRITQPGKRHRAMPDVEATVTLFEHLVDAAAARGLRGMADIVRIGGAVAKATLPVQDSIF
jgi:DNA polymerase III epsilon subunit-like protein